MADTAVKVPNGAPQAPAGANMDETTKAEIDKMWIDAQIEFERITTKTLGKGRGITIDQALTKVQARQTEEFESAAPSKNDDKWQQAKRVGDKMLSCAKFFVAAAKQIAPYTPAGPLQPGVEMCCNALLILLDLRDKMKKFNGSIDQVFSNISAALDQIEIHRRVESMSNIMAKHLHNLMVVFIKVCAHAVCLQQASKLDKAWNQAKNAVGGNDSGLMAAAAEFERVAQNMSKIEQSETFVTVTKTSHQVDRVWDDVRKIREQTEEKSKQEMETGTREKRLRNISTQLGLDAGRVMESNAQDDKAILNKLDGTLGWLTKHDGPYLTWRGQKGRAVQPLVIRGAVKSGKTTAVATLVRDLKDWASSRQQTSVAYHFFPPSVKKADEDPQPVLTALKQMALQICEQDETVARTLNDSLKGFEDEEAGGSIKAKIERYWYKRLRLGSPSTGTSYFLVFDGVESLMERNAEAAQALLDVILHLKAPEASESSIKILLSGTEKTFPEDIEKEVTLIDMVASNSDDMRCYIDSELSRRQLFLDPKPGSPADKARTMLREDLPNQVQGQYTVLLSSLDKIELKVKNERAPLQELRDILDNLNPTHVQNDLVVSLWQRLDPDDIRELNELLVWVMYGARSFEVDELEEALLLHTEEQPLTTLKYRIQNKYSSILVIDNESKVAVQDGIDDMLIRPTRATKDTVEADMPRITATITIHNADMESTQNFLWDLTRDAIRNKFSFDPSAHGSVRHLRKPQIGIHPVDAHLALAQHALKFLQSEDLELGTEISTYLFYYLPWHLVRCLEESEKEETADDDESDAGDSDKDGKKSSPKDGDKSNKSTDDLPKKLVRSATTTFSSSRTSRAIPVDLPNKLTDLEKRDIVRSLEEIFNDDSILKRHSKLLATFYWSPADITYLMKWINPEMVRQYKRSWLSTVASKSPPLPGFLHCWMEIIGEYWLRGTALSEWAVWNWVVTFYNMNFKLENDKDAEKNKPDAAEVAEWYRVVVFKLDKDALDAMWYQRLAERMRSEHPKETIEMLLKARDMVDASWTIEKSLSDVYRWDEDNMELAIKHAQAAVEKCPESDKIEAKLDLISLLSDKAETAAAAVKMLHDIIDESPNSLEAWIELFQLLSCSLHGKDRDMLATISLRLFDDDTKAETVPLHVAVLRRLNTEYYSLSTLSQIAFALSKHDKQRNMFFKALDIIGSTEASGSEKDGFPKADKNWDKWQKMMLAILRPNSQYFSAVLMYHHPELCDDGSRDKALAIWQGLSDSHGKSDIGWSGGRRASRALAFHYEAELERPSADEALCLTQLQKLDSRVESGNTTIPHTKCLRAIYLTQRSRKEAAMTLLREHVQVAINILTDNDETNDASGYSILFQASLLIGDHANSMTALSCLGEADHVEYLRFPKDKMPTELEGWTKPALRRDIRRIRVQILEIVNQRVPAISKQYERMQEAGKVCQELADALPPLDESDKNQASGTTANGTPKDPGTALEGPSSVEEYVTEAAQQISATEAASAEVPSEAPADPRKLPYTILGKWFTEQSKYLGKYEWAAYGLSTWCDCTWEECENKWRFKQDIYMCTNGCDIFLCEKHLADLRDPTRDRTDTFHLCQKGHRWMHAPAWGHEMYKTSRRKGLQNTKAVRVRTGGRITAREGDEQVYEATNWEGYEEVDSDVWLDSIRERWDIKKVDEDKSDNDSEESSSEDEDSSAEDGAA